METIKLDDVEREALTAASMAFRNFQPTAEHGHEAYLHRNKAAIDAYLAAKGRKSQVFDQRVPWTFKVGAFEPRSTQLVHAFSYPEALYMVKLRLDDDCHTRGVDAPVAWDLELVEE